MRKKKINKTEPIKERYVIPGDLDHDSIKYMPQKKTIVSVFFNESDLADFIRNHPDYVIIQVFANKDHITGIFMFYE